MVVDTLVDARTLSSRDGRVAAASTSTTDVVPLDGDAGGGGGGAQVAKRNLLASQAPSCASYAAVEAR